MTADPTARFAAALRDACRDLEVAAFAAHLNEAALEAAALEAAALAVAALATEIDVIAHNTTADNTDQTNAIDAAMRRFHADYLAAAHHLAEDNR